MNSEESLFACICQHNFTREQSIVYKHRAFLRKMKNVTLNVHFLLIQSKFPFHHMVNKTNASRYKL